MANTLKFKRGLLAGLPTAAEGEPLFTTDSNDLYIGTSTGNQRFQKYIASGATTQILRGDGSLYSFPLSISSPSNGQVLKFNGTNWVNDSDAGITGSGSAGQVAYFTGATTQGGSNNLFWDSTNNRLGVGTNSPQYKLDVQGTSNTVAIRAASNTANDILYYATGTVTGQLNAFLTAINATGAVSGALLNNNSATGSAFLDINVTAASTGDPYLSLTTSGATNWSIGIDNSDSDKLKIGPNSNPSVGTPSMTMFTGGNIAIGSITDTTEKLQVTGNAKITGTLNLTGNVISQLNVASHFLQTSAGLFRIENTGASAPTGASGTGVEISKSGSIGYIECYNRTTSAYNQLNLRGSTVLVTGDTTFGSSITATTDISARSGDISIGLDTQFSTPYMAIGWGGRSNAFNRIYAARDATAGLIISAATGQGINLRTNGHSATGIYMASDGGVAFKNSAGNDRAVIDVLGNIGISITSSYGNLWRALDIGTAGGSIALRPANAEINFVQNAYHNNASWIYKANGTAGISSIDVGNFRWFTAPSGTAGNTVTFTEQMRLYNATGNLCLGAPTSDTGEKFQVTGTAKITGAVSSNVVFRTNHTGTGNEMTYIGERGGGVNGGYIQLRNTNVVTVGIDSNGASFFNGGNVAFDTDTLFVDATNNRIGIGTNVPTQKLDVRDGMISVQRNSNSSVVNFNIFSGTTPVSAFQINSDQSVLTTTITSRNSYVLDLATNDTARIRIKTEGHVRFVPLSAAPTTNVQSGDVYYDSTTNKLRCYNGTSWNDLF